MENTPLGGISADVIWGETYYKDNTTREKMYKKRKEKAIGDEKQIVVTGGKISFSEGRGE